MARTDTNATAFYHSDGNGNITAMIYTNQLLAAKYLYDPFGNTLSLSGPLAQANTYRFSSKEWNDIAGLYYYGQRFYDPSLQRWPNRDPIRESGGINLYALIGNNPIDNVDEFGLMSWNDVLAVKDNLEQQVHDQTCCCHKSGPHVFTVSITGTPSGSTVTERMTFEKKGCALTIWHYYWWNCFHAQVEGHSYLDRLGAIYFGGDPNAWQQYGYYEGSPTDTQKHRGSVNSGWSDSNHWNWRAIIIFTECGPDKHIHASLAISTSDLQWTWNGATKSWANPQPPSN